MNRFFGLTLLIFLSFQLFPDDSEYLEKVRLEPEHGHLNYDGEIKIFFDLPKNDLVEKVYVTYTFGVNEYNFPTELNGSDLGYLNNSITIKGSELYDILTNTGSGTASVRLFSLVAAGNDDDILDDDNIPNNDDIVNDEDFINDEDVMNDDDVLVENDDDGAESDSDPEIPDNDSAEGDHSSKDGEYTIKLVLDLDTSGNNSEDNETDDSDTAPVTTGTIPETVISSLKITFDNAAPDKPESIETEGGDGRIILRVSPPLKSNNTAEKIGRYHATVSGLFKNEDGEEIESSIDYSSKVDEGDYAEKWEFSVSGKNGLELINNDNASSVYIYKIKVWAEDIAGNTDPSALIETEESAVTTYGFWNNYKDKGGKDDGGFCFIATAGFGSYFHPNVRLLRNFRDTVLAKFSFGRSFIRAYYKYGSVPAETIRESSILRAASRTFLTPVVIAVWFITTSAGRLMLLLWSMIFAFFILKRKKTAMFTVLFIILVFPLKAYPVDGEFSFNSGFYYPSKIDDESVGKPFKDVGGSDLRYLPSLNFGFKVPVLENYIRWSFTGGIGFTRFKGTSVKADGTKSEDETAMYFIPLNGEMKLRPAYDFPLWPYASIGIDYYIWWIREKGETAQDGGTFGFHGTFGLMVSLNWLDDSSSKKFKESTGIENTSLFVHYRLEKINDFGKEKSFDLSGSRFEFGIIFEF